MSLNNEQKTVVNNGIYIYILNLFSTIIPMLTIPYVTRVLGAEGYGQFSIAFNWINYIQVLVEYGFAMYGARRIAISKDQDTINRCFSEILTTRIFLCGLSFIVMTMYIVVAIEDPHIYISMYILFLMAVGSMFQQNWLLQGMEKMQYITIISVVSRLVTLVLIFLFVKNSNDVYVYCFLYALTLFLIGFSGFIFVRQKLNVKFIRIPLRNIPHLLHEAFYTFISILGGRVMTSVGVTVLGIMATQSEVGIYGAINKVPTVIVMMFSPISQAIYPYISKKFEESYRIGLRQVRKIGIPVTLIFIIIAIIFSAFSQPIIRIAFGSEYTKYHGLLSVFMIWIVFSIINNFTGIQSLVGSGNSRQYGISFLVSAGISIISSIALVSDFGLYGAAIALVVAEASLSLFNTYSIWNILRKDYHKAE